MGHIEPIPTHYMVDISFRGTSTITMTGPIKIFLILPLLEMVTTAVPKWIHANLSTNHPGTYRIYAKGGPTHTRTLQYSYDNTPKY